MEFIVMLTWHDKTVENSMEIFENAKDAPATAWGFKNVGLEKEKLIELSDKMKEAGKSVYLEVLDYDPKNAYKYVDTCKELGATTLLGTVYSKEALELAHSKGIKYYPFAGTQLPEGGVGGTIEEIIEQTKQYKMDGVDGVNLPIFRYKGDGRKLLQEINKNVGVPICVAGSVSNADQIKFLKENGVVKFTMGGALFENKFGDTFAEGIEKVDKIVKEI